MFPLLFINYLIGLEKLTHTHTQSYNQHLGFESYKSHCTKCASVVDEGWEFAQPPTLTRSVGWFACTFLYSVLVSRGSDRMWRGNSWPSTGTLFRKQMWYIFFLPQVKWLPLYFGVTIFHLLIPLRFSHSQQPCGLLITLFSHYWLRLKT